MIRFDIIIAPVYNPLEQLTIEVDAIGAKTAEKFVKDFFPQMSVLCVSPHKEHRQTTPTFRDRIEWTVRRLKKT